MLKRLLLTYKSKHLIKLKCPLIGNVIDIHSPRTLLEQHHHTSLNEPDFPCIKYVFLALPEQLSLGP